MSAPVRTLASSPLTNPVALKVRVGLATPYARALSSAVTVSGAGSTVRVPGVKVIV